MNPARWPPSFRLLTMPYGYSPRAAKESRIPLPEGASAFPRRIKSSRPGQGQTSRIHRQTLYSRSFPSSQKKVRKSQKITRKTASLFRAVSSMVGLRGRHEYFIRVYTATLTQLFCRNKTLPCDETKSGNNVRSRG